MKMKIAAIVFLAITYMSCNNEKKTSSESTIEGQPNTSKTIDNPITEKYWKLKTLEGKDIKMIDNQEKEMYFMLKTHENKVVGFAGCNTISGTYTLIEGNRIQFAKMATTLMACPDVDAKETDFLKVLELADNYTIVNGVLSLNAGKRAAMAVFEAIYFQ